MERLRAQACAACRGWPAERVTEIVSRYLKDLILPYVYAEARALPGSKVGGRRRSTDTCLRVRVRQPGTHARPVAGGEPGQSATAHWHRAPVPAVAGRPAQ